MNPETVDIEPRRDREPPWVAADPDTTERLRITLLNAKVKQLRDPDDPDPYTYRLLLTNGSAARLADRLEQWKHWDDDRKADERDGRTQQAAARRERRRVLVALAWAVPAAAVAFAVAWVVLWWLTLPVQPVQDDFALVMGRLVVLASAVFVGVGTYFTRKGRP